MALLEIASARVLAWLINFTVHGAVWWLVAFVVTWSATRSSHARAAMWKAAVVAPVFTATIALRHPLDWLVTKGGAGGAPDVAGAVRDAGTVGTRVIDRLPTTWLALVLLSASLAGALHFVGGMLLAARRRRARQPVGDRRLVARFRRACARAGLRDIILTTDERLTSPAVIGAREVCISAATLTHVSDEELDAIFAHELAHIERVDGIWFPIVAGLRSLFWFQPFVVAAATRFRSCAELAADDRAVAITANPRSLATALARFATSDLAAADRVVATMAQSRAEVVRRVRRLVTTSSTLHTVDRAHTRRVGRRITVAAFALGIATSFLGVRVLSASERCRERAQTAAAVSDDLRWRAARLEHRLEQATATSAVQSIDVEETPVVLELRQALRHTHAALHANETKERCQ